MNGDAIGAGHRTIGGIDVVTVEWDFRVRGGSFGDREATLFAECCSQAAASRTPLVTVLRSGGTRLHEGMRALVGIPRAVLALDELADAGVPHLAVADHPTTGGVWVAIGSVADLRVGVRGATVGFSGSRVVEAMTGVSLPPGANTSESAAAAGLLDAVVAAEEIDGWLASALRALSADRPVVTARPAPFAPTPADRDGWAQVVHSRTQARPAGADLLAELVDQPVHLGTVDPSVTAAVGRLGGRRVCVVAIAATRAGRVTPAGFRLLTRAAMLAGRLDLALVTLVDTAGADALPASEQSGLAPAIADAMRAVLRCASPTVAVVHGEGGSGGALAAAVTDLVAVTRDGWFAALGPEGAAAALRRTPEEAAGLMDLTPRDLLTSGFADAMAPTGPALRDWLAASIERLRRLDRVDRLARRRMRWGSGLPGSPRIE